MTVLKLEMLNRESGQALVPVKYVWLVAEHIVSFTERATDTTEVVLITEARYVVASSGDDLATAMEGP